MFIACFYRQVHVTQSNL
jgi:hypothetical protein